MILRNEREMLLRAVQLLLARERGASWDAALSDLLAEVRRVIPEEELEEMEPFTVLGRFS